MIQYSQATRHSWFFLVKETSVNKSTQSLFCRLQTDGEKILFDKKRESQVEVAEMWDLLLCSLWVHSPLHGPPHICNCIIWTDNFCLTSSYSSQFLYSSNYQVISCRWHGNHSPPKREEAIVKIVQIVVHIYQSAKRVKQYSRSAGVGGYLNY